MLTRPIPRHPRLLLRQDRPCLRRRRRQQRNSNII